MMNEKLKEALLYIIPACVVALLVCGAYILYKQSKEPVEIQGTTQSMVETPKGVEITANKAGYSLDRGQTERISTVIKEIRTENKEPVYVVKTDGKNAVKDSEQARKDNKADFSIIADKDNPDYKVDLSKLDKDQSLTLQQYNIQAYKKVIRTIDYEPIGKQATFTISRKITNDGQYIGVGVGYDFEHDKVVAKVSYSW